MLILISISLVKFRTVWHRTKLWSIISRGISREKMVMLGCGHSRVDIGELVCDDGLFRWVSTLANRATYSLSIVWSCWCSVELQLNLRTMKPTNLSLSLYTRLKSGWRSSATWKRAMKLHTPKRFLVINEWRCIRGVASPPLFGGVGVFFRWPPIKATKKMFCWSKKKKKPQSLQWSNFLRGKEIC